MTPIDIGLSDANSQAASAGSGGFQVGGNTYMTNPIVWIVVGVVALVALVIFLKLRR